MSKYELYCADVESVLPTLDCEVDCVITDPPYGVNINKKWDGSLPRAEVWCMVNDLLKPGGHCAIFCQPSMSQEFFTIMADTPLEYRDTWIWAYQGTHTKGYKTKDGFYRSRIRNVYNPIHIYRKSLEGSEQSNWDKYKTNLLNIEDNRQVYVGDHSSIRDKYEATGEKHLQAATKSNTFGGLDRKGWVPNAAGAEPTNIQYVSRATKAERTINGKFENTHETVKPVALMMWLVNLFTSSEDQTVLDIFMGTGSTGMACSLLGRDFVGIEEDDDVVHLATNRIDYVYLLDKSKFKCSPVQGIKQ